MSDLANSCEYLTVDKLCSAVSESEKAKANRQLRCQNDEKMSCCYICQSRRECSVKCMFLGNTENQPAPVDATKTEVKESKISEDKETEAIEKEGASVTYCSLCNAEMSKTKTTFKIDGLDGQKLAGDDSGKPIEVLPVTVFVCPQCGKIELEVDRSSKSS